MSDIYEITLLPPVMGRTVGLPYYWASWSRASGMVVVLASPLTVLRACLRPVAPVGGVVMAVAVHGALRRMR